MDGETGFAYCDDSLGNGLPGRFFVDMEEHFGMAAFQSPFPLFLEKFAMDGSCGVEQDLFGFTEPLVVSGGVDA